MNSAIGPLGGGGEVGSAIVCDTRLEWYLHNRPEEHKAIEIRHYAIVLALCVTRGYACSSGFRAVLPAENTPPGLFYRGSASAGLLARLSSQFVAPILEAVDHSFQGYVDRIQCYIVSEKDNGVLKAIERLSKAKDGLDQVDKALDLGVALEMLLLSDTHGNSEKVDQLSLTFRLRGSKFLGGTIEQRKQNYKLLKEIYEMRSKAAHTGKLSGNQQIEEKHFFVAQDIFRKVLSQGKPNDWAELLLK